MLTFDLIIASVTQYLLPLSLGLLLLSIIIDILKRKFKWTKYALVLVIITFVLLIAGVTITYLVTRDVTNVSK